MKPGEAIGNLSQTEARRVIDATGLIVSPGFIDTHAHSDGALLLDPQHANGLRQGITTEILGQDGLSYAPLSAENYRTYRRYLAGILGEPPDDLDMSSVTASFVISLASCIHFIPVHRNTNTAPASAPPMLLSRGTPTTAVFPLDNNIGVAGLQLLLLRP